MLFVETTYTGTEIIYIGSAKKYSFKPVSQVQFTGGRTCFGK